MDNRKHARHFSIWKDGKLQKAHRVLVEQICSIKLQPHNVIHHRNGDGFDNTPSNLIVCENDEYHNLLEYRTKAYRASGHANWKYCCHCKSWDDPVKMQNKIRYRKSNGQGIWYHRTCRSKAEYDRRHKNDNSTTKSSASSD